MLRPGHFDNADDERPLTTGAFQYGKIAILRRGKRSSSCVHCGSLVGNGRVGKLQLIKDGFKPFESCAALLITSCMKGESKEKEAAARRLRHIGRSFDRCQDDRHHRLLSFIFQPATYQQSQFSLTLWSNQSVFQSAIH